MLLALSLSERAVLFQFARGRGQRGDDGAKAVAGFAMAVLAELPVDAEIGGDEVFGIEHVGLGDGVLHRGLLVAGRPCRRPEARNRHLGLDRLHQLVGDEHLPAADIPVRRDAGALMQFAELARSNWHRPGRNRRLRSAPSAAAAGEWPPASRPSRNSAGVGIVVPDLVIEPCQDAGQVFGEEWPHGRARWPASTGRYRSGRGGRRSSRGSSAGFRGRRGNGPRHLTTRMVNGSRISP